MYHQLHREVLQLGPYYYERLKEMNQMRTITNVWILREVDLSKRRLDDIVEECKALGPKQEELERELGYDYCTYTAIHGFGLLY